MQPLFFLHRLAHGCLSPRQIFWEITRYEKQRTANQSTYWVIFELLWRDYFKFVALKFGDRLFYKSGEYTLMCSTLFCQIRLNVSVDPVCDIGRPCVFCYKDRSKT